MSVIKDLSYSGIKLECDNQLRLNKAYQIQFEKAKEIFEDLLHIINLNDEQKESELINELTKGKFDRELQWINYIYEHLKYEIANTFKLIYNKQHSLKYLIVSVEHWKPNTDTPQKKLNNLTFLMSNEDLEGISKHLSGEGFEKLKKALLNEPETIDTFSEIIVSHYKHIDKLRENEIKLKDYILQIYEIMGDELTENQYKRLIETVNKHPKKYQVLFPFMNFIQQKKNHITNDEFFEWIAEDICEQAGYIIEAKSVQRSYYHYLETKETKKPKNKAMK